jgi:pimeloyl-ACP methyl ester carboxylesterase
MRAPKTVMAAAAAVLVFTACSSSSKSSANLAAPSTTTSIVAAPAGLPKFYSYAEPIPTRPGALITSQRVVAPNIKGSVYRVLYTSTTIDSKATPVSGLVFVPNTPAPAAGYPVVTWGHGTNGMADSCTPSLTPDSAVPLINMLLDQGWEVTASDQQGEGTPGLMPYIAGDSAARNTIDIVRAARNMPSAHASANYVVWGHSEGGQTAMYALHIGPAYAPELNLKGVVAGAPPSQFNLIYAFLKTSPFKYYLLMAAGGLNTAYGDSRAPLDQVLTPEGIKLVALLDKGCAGYVSDHLKNVDIATITKTDPFSVPLWKKVLEANDPQQFTTKSPVPLLMIQGANDEQIPPVSTQILAKHLCDLHQDLERWIYPGQSHSGVIGPSAADMVHWITDRFANAPNPDPYAPKGLANVDTTTCP